MIFCICLFTAGLVNTNGQETLSDFKTKQEQELERFANENKIAIEALSSEYDLYAANQVREFDQFQADVEKKWDTFESSTSKTWVDYDSDLRSRSSVNFEKGEIQIDVLVDKSAAKSEAQNLRAAQSLLEKKINKLVQQKAADKQRLLKDQMVTVDSKKVTTSNLKRFAAQSVTSNYITHKTVRAKDGQPRTKYSVTIKMVPNHLEVRAKRFKGEILKQSKRFHIDPAVAFAVMQTESYFNPNARSHVPAYGLMQLVPKSGARDAYQFVYKKDRLLKDSYLYNPANNIELGCAYLSKLRHVYFGDISDDRVAYHCTIAAYNTGPGNVSRALTGTTKLAPATEIANTKSPDQIYRILLQKLPYDETKDYLTKVTSRVDNYRAWTE